MSGLSAEFILRHDNRPPRCSHQSREERQREIERMRLAPAYAVGEVTNSDQPKKAVLMANWNNFSSDAVDLLERAGYSIGWSDEWDICYNCGNAFRVKPDSYGWQPKYVEFPDGERHCPECADFEGCLESLEDDPRRCCFAYAVDPGEYGYQLVTEPGGFENGFHPGQNDTPEDILRDLHERGIRRVVFRTSSTGQFDINFEAWAKTEDKEAGD